MNATDFIVQNAQELTTEVKSGGFQPDRGPARLRRGNNGRADSQRQRRMCWGTGGARGATHGGHSCGSSGMKRIGSKGV